MTKITRPDATEVLFSYAPASGLLSTIATPEGNYLRTYNSANQLVSLVSPNSVALSWEHDGSLLSKQNMTIGAVTAHVEYSFDKLLPTSQSVTTSLGDASTVSFNFDRDRLLNQAGALQITRDQNGLVTETQLGAVRELFTYSGDFGEVLEYRVLSAGLEVYRETYTRDSLGRISGKTVTQNGTSTVYTYTFDTAGRLIEVLTNGQRTRAYSYDSNSNRLTLTQFGVTSPPPPQTCVCKDKDDDRDGGHRGRWQKKKKQKKPSCYLVQEDDKRGRGHKKHHHHHHGKKVPCTPTEPQPTTVVTNGTYDAQDRILSYGGTQYTHNARGEIVLSSSSAGSIALSYDSLGGLTRVVSGSNTWDYINDGLGRRVEVRLNGAAQRRYLYDEQSRLLAELNSDGSIRNRYVYGSRSHSPDYLLQGGVEFKIVHDQLGSVRMIMNAVTGEIVSQLSYDEFGRITSSTNPDFQPLGFAGGLRDSATSLVRFGARDYDPEVGRWTSKDPILFEGGDTNLFGYVLQDPINLIDPEGKSPAAWIGIGIVIINQNNWFVYYYYGDPNTIKNDPRPPRGPPRIPTPPRNPFPPRPPAPICGR